MVRARNEKVNKAKAKRADRQNVRSAFLREGMVFPKYFLCESCKKLLNLLEQCDIIILIVMIKCVSVCFEHG